MAQKSHQCCTRFTTAKPTQPSFDRTTSPTVAFGRAARTPPACVSSVWGLNNCVMSTASSDERSITPPPPPDVTLRRSPTSVATAAKTPTMYSPC
jgi:hypothetical protein